MFVVLEIKNKFPLCLPKRNEVSTFTVGVRVGVALLGFHTFKEESLLYISPTLTLKNPCCFFYSVYTPSVSRDSRQENACIA